MCTVIVRQRRPGRELALVHSEYEQKLAAQAKAADLHAIEAEDRIRHLEQMVADLESRLAQGWLMWPAFRDSAFAAAFVNSPEHWGKI